MGESETEFPDQDACHSTGAFVRGCKQRSLGHFSAKCRGRRKIVNGVARHADAKEKKPWQGAIRFVHAMTPAEGVDHFRNAFGKDEGNQSPAERSQFAPDLARTGLPDQVCEKER